MAKGAHETKGQVSTEALGAVHAPVLQFFPELVAELGGDPAALLAQIGIAPAADGTHAAGYPQVADLLELAAERLDCADFGLRLARLQCSVPDSVSSPLGDATRHARNFGEALEFVSRHSYAHSLAAGFWLKRVRAGKATMLGHDLLLERLPAKRQVVEQVLLTAHLWAIRLTGGLARARGVYFRHQPMSSPRTYRSYFGCDVSFGEAVNAILYYDRDLSRPLLAANHEAREAAVALIESQFQQREPPLSALARGVILHVLGTDLCRTDFVAEKLKLHPRTLHRRLREEGASFRAIHDEVRRDMLGYYLRQTDLGFADISERLGFSEQSVLTRYCRRWFGRPPTVVRLAARGGGSEA
jgi:AraC-like DNA-binding protein